MRLKAIIVDDEPIARSFLEKYCQKNGNVEIAGSFPSAETALDYLKTNEVDLVFLDVEMPGENGFHLLDQLDYMPNVILTASKTEYAFQAFKYNVLDYLKKPFTFAQFQDSISKVLAKDFTAKTPENKEDIFIKSDGKLTRLNYSDILYIESVGDYVKYITLSKQYLTHSTLKAIEEKMDVKHFMKVHRSYIVNLHKIMDIQDYSLVIEGKVIPISKSYKSSMLQKINVG